MLLLALFKYDLDSASPRGADRLILGAAFFKHLAPGRRLSMPATKGVDEAEGFR